MCVCVCVCMCVCVCVHLLQLLFISLTRAHTFYVAYYLYNLEYKKYFNT